MRNPKHAIKKMVAAILGLTMAVSLTVTPCRALAAEDQTQSKGGGETTLHDGTYEGSAKGYNSVISVKVTVTGGEISNVEVVSQNETEIYWNSAKAVIDSIVSKKTPEVDTVSGATYSSKGIINAVKNALEKSAAGPDADIDKPQADWFNGGTGTKKNPFQIKTAEQLIKFASSVDNQVNYAGYFVKLTSDIDLGNTGWNPVGGGQNAFYGTFDGGNHTVSRVTIGAKDNPYVLENDVQMIGFFGILGDTAVIKNLTLKNICMNVEGASGTLSVGGISGNFETSEKSEPLIDHCSVQGTITGNTGKGNCFVGGITGRQVSGRIINSKTDVKLNGTSGGGYVEAGGISGMNNEGLIANCYTLGSIQGNGTEGDTEVVAGGIAGLVQGDIVNCYEKGNIVSKLKTDLAGMVAGWHREGKGKIYNCFYNANAKFSVNNANVKKKAVGYVEEAEMDEEGLYYLGGLQLELKSYKASSVKAIAKKLNSNFSKFAIDIKSTWKLKAKALRKWKSSGKEVTFAKTYATVKYVQPESEKVPQKYIKMKDGIWYGRDEGKTSIVKIKTVNDKVTKIETISGKTSGKGYKEAVKKAQDKARYGDTSGYEAADASQFGGGDGTKENPYLITSEAQLRYIAEAINEDVSWEGCYFKQTEDVTLGSKEWLPIGWTITGFYKSRWQTFCEYPFKGNYDGGNHKISGLSINTGTKSSSDERKMYNAGLFGYTLGDVQAHGPIKEGTRLVEIKNVKLENVKIITRAQTETYAGALIATAADGVVVDNCSATGTVSAKAETSDVYAGGLIAFPWFGAIVQNCHADVEVAAKVKKGNEAGTVYAGGLYGCDMRATTLNSYALGNVTADGNKDSIYIGGISGENAGAHYNTYATGNVTALTETKYIGALSGGMVGIGVDYCGYYSSSAKVTSGKAQVSPVIAYGETSMIGERANTVAMDAAQMTDGAFAKTLTDNLVTVKEAVEKMQAALPARPPHTVYYTGDGSDLYSWTVVDGRVTQAANAADAK